MLTKPLELVVLGHPPRKDSWYAHIIRRRDGKPGRTLSLDAKDWTSRLEFVWLQARRDMIMGGEWSLDLMMHVATRANMDGEIYPRRDCDSAVSCVMDALQRVGAIDNDIRIAPIRLDRKHDPKTPRTVIVLRPIDFDAPPSF